MKLRLLLLFLALWAAPDALACYRCKPTVWAPSLAACPDMCKPAALGAAECETIAVEDPGGGVLCQCWLSEWGCGLSADAADEMPAAAEQCAAPANEQR